jgi:hypothetical protein
LGCPQCGQAATACEIERPQAEQVVNCDESCGGAAPPDLLAAVTTETTTTAISRPMPAMMAISVGPMPKKASIAVTSVVGWP